MITRRKTRLRAFGSAVIVAALVTATGSHAQNAPTTDEVRSIAQEAATYGLPMVMAYGVMYEYAIDKGSNQYKAPFNQIHSLANLATPKDTAVVTPNSDTLYSVLWTDLRAEPVVLCVPEIEKDRYYSVQLISQYTFNFGYIGSRTTGNGAGCYAVAGPAWSGATPAGVAKVFTSETDFALVLYRTQLFNPADIDKVRAIQAEYVAQPLSKFLGQPAPAAAPEITWPKIDKAMAEADPFGYLAFLLQFAPATGPAAIEEPLRAKFASIGIEAGKPFKTDGLSDEAKAALAEGGKAAAEAIKKRVETAGSVVNGWNISSSLFGDRAMINGDWTLRAAAAMVGIFGNDAAEALYPFGKHDAEGKPLDASKANYTLAFPEGELPPVNSFWSVTMYDGKTQLLVDNPINRYLINSPMLPDLKKNPDGSLTLYIQKDKPTDADQAANWLPAPDGPIYLVMRLYWPQEAALKGTWKPPAVQRAR
jgi:hypothetical protein